MNPLKIQSEALQALQTLVESKDQLNQYTRADIYNRLSYLLFEFLGNPHPTFNVISVPIDKIKTNDYNPNKMATPECRLLKHSIEVDGLTMPIVVTKPDKDGIYTVIDGAHRLQIIKRNPELTQSTDGHIPVSILDKSYDYRISSTVRHNIARGTHQIELTAKLVVELKSMNWSNDKIGQELGMDPDEVLRMQQITGLAEAFRDKSFSASWT